MARWEFRIRYRWDTAAALSGQTWTSRGKNSAIFSLPRKRNREIHFNYCQKHEIPRENVPSCFIPLLNRSFSRAISDLVPPRSRRISLDILATRGLKIRFCPRGKLEFGKQRAANECSYPRSETSLWNEIRQRRIRKLCRVDPKLHSRLRISTIVQRPLQLFLPGNKRGFDTTVAVAPPADVIHLWFPCRRNVSASARDKGWKLSKEPPPFSWFVHRRVSSPSIHRLRFNLPRDDFSRDQPSPISPRISRFFSLLSFFFFPPFCNLLFVASTPRASLFAYFGAQIVWRGGRVLINFSRWNKAATEWFLFARREPARFAPVVISLQRPLYYLRSLFHSDICNKLNHGSLPRCATLEISISKADHYSEITCPVWGLRVQFAIRKHRQEPNW